MRTSINSTAAANLNWSSVKTDVGVSAFAYQEAMSDKGLIRIERNDSDANEDLFHVIHNNVFVGVRKTIDAARSLATRFAAH